MSAGMNAFGQLIQYSGSGNAVDLLHHLPDAAGKVFLVVRTHAVADEVVALALPFIGLSLQVGKVVKADGLAEPPDAAAGHIAGIRHVVDVQIPQLVEVIQKYCAST